MNGVVLATIQVRSNTLTFSIIGVYCGIFHTHVVVVFLLVVVVMGLTSRTKKNEVCSCTLMANFFVVSRMYISSKGIYFFQ